MNSVVYLECQCHLLNHVMRASLFDFGEECIDSEMRYNVSLEVALDSEPSFWRRLVLALKYLFRRDACCWYAETMLGASEVMKLHDLLHDYCKLVTKDSA